MPEVDAPLEVEEPGGRRRVTLADLKGDQGDQGDDGAAGQDGADGADGAPGADGLPRRVQEDGVDLPVRSKLNAGTGITATDDAVNDRTTLSVESGVESVNGETGVVVLSAGDVGAQPVDSDLTAIAALTTTAFGRALLELANAAAGRTALGLGTAATAATGDFDAAGAAAAAQAASQPLDSDLTAIAALSTTAYGRAFLALADAAAGRTALGLGTAATAATGDFDAAGAAAAAQAASQPLDSDLTAIAALATTSFGRSLLALADAAALLSTAGAQASDSDLTAIAGIAPTNDDLIQRKAGAWTNRTPAQVKTDLALAKGDVGLGNVDNTADTAKPVSTAQQAALDAKQALDSDLTDIAALAPSNDTVIQRKSGVWVARSMAQIKTDLALAKSDVGLGNVDNTSDASKPVSTAQQTALDLKVGVRGPAPADIGFLAYNFDPLTASESYTPNTGFLFYMRVPLVSASQHTKVHLWVWTAATTPTAGQCFVGVHNSAGTLLGKADIVSALGSTGMKTITLTAEAGQSLPTGNPSSPPYVHVVFLQNAAAGALLIRQVNTGIPMEGLLTASTGRFVRSSSGGKTSLPAAALTETVDGAHRIWVGLS